MQGAPVLVLGGEWTVHTADAAEKALQEALAPLGYSKSSKLPIAASLSAIDISGVTLLDTSGAMLINACRSAGGPSREPSASASLPKAARLPLVSKNAEYTALIDFCPDPPTLAQEKEDPLFTRWLVQAGESITEEAKLLWQMLGFLGHFLVCTGKTLLTPWRLNFTSLVYHMDQVGLKALPIVGLLSFLIGLVIAYMAAVQLVTFGAQIFVIPLLEIATTREMGVLMTSILVAGRSGSSFTAQIGAMVSNEEVDAMRTMGLDPMGLLVVPRVLALVLMLPILVMVADVMSILGGLVAVWVSMDITPTVFFYTLQKDINLRHFFLGLFKTPFFAVTIGCVGCYLGFNVTGSSESVGRLTTKAVVEAIFLVIVLDAVFALLYSSMGL